MKMDGWNVYAIVLWALLIGLTMFKLADDPPQEPSKTETYNYILTTPSTIKQNDTMAYHGYVDTTRGEPEKNCNGCHN